MHRITDRNFFAQDAVALSRALLGKLIVHDVNGQRLVLRITETEAYMGVADQASHSKGGRLSHRNRIMFGAPGFVYVFMIYGLYYCFNITCNEPGQHEAVLIRAGEPVVGTQVMLCNRGLDQPSKSQAAKLRSIADGPGKVAMALGLTMDQYGQDLTDPSPSSRLFIAQDEFAVDDADIVVDVRIGIDYAGQDRDRPWRFYLKDHVVSVSKAKRLKQQQKKITRNAVES